MASAPRTGNRPYSGRPKTSRSQPTGDFDAPTPAERRRMDAEQAAPYKEAYESGVKAGRQGAAKGKSASSGKAGKARPRRPPARRRPVPGARSARTAVRQLQAPVRAQVTSGIRIFGLTLAVVALYNVLTGPGPAFFSGALGGVSKALEWLSSPVAVPTRK